MLIKNVMLKILKFIAWFIDTKLCILQYIFYIAVVNYSTHIGNKIQVIGECIGQDETPIQ